MDFKIISKTEGAAVIDNGINKFLAINSGLKNKAFVGVDTSKLQSLPGLIIENGEIHNWKLEGITEIDGITYYFGPYLEGKTLPELDLNPHILLELTAALHIIKDRKFPVRQFSLSSVFCTDDGRILFFPPHLMDFLNTHRKRQNSLKMIEPWNNPKLGGNEGRSFTIAALAYKSLTGEIPFAGESEEDIDKLISKKNYRSPLMVEPLLKKEIYSLIDDSFDGKGTLRLWRDVLTSWKSDGAIDRSLSMKDKEDIVTAQRKVDQKRIQRAKVSDFFFKNKTKLIVAIAVLASIGAILQAPISKYLEPPVTMGMSQKDVINLYYLSYKNLDTEKIEDCITSKAGKGDINEISTIYVTSKVRTSYEGNSGLVDPEQWIADGRKPQLPGVQVWGISDLVIKRLSDDTFEANYTKWQPPPSDDIEDTSAKLPVSTKIKDTLHLSIIDDAWKIDQLDRVY